MVNIDTVYQKVLMFANKEQRGYITPQEFNILANLAQMEIFEQYFYDLNQFERMPGNEMMYGDMVDNLEDKISPFEKSTSISYGGISHSFFYDNFWRLGTVSYLGTEIEEVQPDEIILINKSHLTKPTMDRPVYVRTGSNSIKVYPTEITDPIQITYTCKPDKPNWTYVVVNGKAMQDPGNAAHFQLHPAEESELVYKILKFAGLSMRRDDIAQAGQMLESAQVQQEKQ